MVRRTSFLAAALVWFLCASTLWAQADPLSVIPEDALGLAVLNRLADTNARVQKLTQKMQLPVPDLLPMAQMFTGIQQGLDTKGGLAAAVFADDHEDALWGMSLAVFVPVTDYKVFLEQLQPEDVAAQITEVTVLGGKYLAAKKGDFAVLTSTSQKHLLEHVLASSKNAAAGLAPLHPWLGEQQAAVVVTPAGKKLLFAKAGEFLNLGLEATEAEAASDADQKKDEDDDKKPGADEGQAIKELIKSGKELLTEAEAEVTQFGVGIRIDDQTAVHVSARALFTPQGKLSEWAAEVKVPKGGLLAGLPASKFVIAYGGVTPNVHPALAHLIDRLTETGLEKMGLDEELRKKYATAVARQRANRLNSCGLLGQLRPGDSIAATSVMIEHVRDGKNHIKLTRDVLEVVQAATANNSETKKSIYEINEVTIGDLKVLEVVTDMNALLGAGNPDAAMAEQLQGFFSKLFGNEGVMRIYLAAADDHTVVSGYSKELLQRGVAHVRSGEVGLERDPQIARTVALLPNGVQWAAYVSPQGLLQWVDALMREVLPAQMNFRIPPFPPSDPIGLGAKVSGAGLDAEIVLPENVVAGIGQYVGLLQQMMQGGAAPVP